MTEVHLTECSMMSFCPAVCVCAHNPVPRIQETLCSFRVIRRITLEKGFFQILRKKFILKSSKACCNYLNDFLHKSRRPASLTDTAAEYMLPNYRVHAFLLQQVKN